MDHTHEPRLEFDVLDTGWLQEELEPLPENPVAIIDIDSTIMDTAPRNRGILEAARRLFPQIEAVIPTMNDSDLGWGVAATAADRAGLSSFQRERLKSFWAERFFSNQWVACDHPYPGVRSFLFELKRHGLHLVYLTGRDEPNMCEGTIASFRRHDLPVDKNTTFLFKPNAADDDITFKQSAIDAVRRIGVPVLAIDNEPGNANTFRHAFP